LSVWLKRIDGNSNYNFYGGGGSKSITITDEWKRYDFSFVADGTNNTFFGIQDPNPSGFGSYYVYGAQVEQKSFATSYIPTNGSQTTRNQETCINATPEINSEEGVLYFEASSKSNSLNKSITLFGQNANDRVEIKYRSNNTSVQVNIFSSGSLDFNAVESLAIESINKIAVKYKQNDFALWINGVKVATDTSGNTPTGLVSLNFNVAGGNYFFGNTKDIQVYTKALSDAELIKLTT